MPSVYAKVESIVNELGGRLWHERTGNGVTWFVSLPGFDAKQCPSDGKGGVPLLDVLYEPKIADPQVHSDYSNTLRVDARERLLSMVNRK